MACMCTELLSPGFLSLAGHVTMLVGVEFGPFFRIHKTHVDPCHHQRHQYWLPRRRYFISTRCNSIVCRLACS